MKALFTRQSAENQGSAIAIAALIAIMPLVFPHPKIVQAAEVQTDAQTALVFNIKDPKILEQQNIANQKTQTTLAYNQVVAEDPLNKDLKTYLVDKSSPLADYTEDILKCSDWKRLLAISYVESNMGIHHYSYNSSGIGGQKYLRKYSNYSEWIADMCSLLDSRYNGWSIDKMNGVYVQPKSRNWGYGANKILDELSQLEAQSNQERSLAFQPGSQLAAAITQA